MEETRVPGSKRRTVKSTRVKRTSARKRQNNKLDPSLQEYLEWLSLHWAEIFAEQQISERQQPLSSSS